MTYIGYHKNVCSNLVYMSILKSYHCFSKKLRRVFCLKLHIFQIMSKEDTTQKTYVYELAIPIAPRWVSLVAGQLEILPDQTNFLISNLCLPHDLPRLRNTMEFFHEAYRSVDFVFWRLVVVKLNLNVFLFLLDDQLLQLL